MIRVAAWLAVIVTVMVVTTLPAFAACDIYDRACWDAKRAQVMSGRLPLYERNKLCEDMLLEIDKVAQQALGHLYARDQVFSPTGRGVDYDNTTGGVGYIDHGSVVQIERELLMVVNNAIRDVRMTRYDGADLRSCADITDRARNDILAIRDALP